MGMLAGLQHLGPDRQPLKDSRGRDIIGLPRLGASKPLRVGLVWIGERGDFNTPNTTTEGDMGLHIFGQLVRTAEDQAAFPGGHQGIAAAGRGRMSIVVMPRL